MDNYFTVNEIAQGLKVHRKTVIRWIGTGELRAFKLGNGGRLWRIYEHDLTEFIKSRQPKPKI